ncbi:ketoacyl-ACP synthase III family protein [Actinacidiphila glaucinigra]|uniref:ketoacyl-ACP synthase III family protein n=1 Tax=Actinacidiphila glaucinigra TaxID=235986 RepID=UPI002DDB7E0C|nr:ketoacyl-ACP synthase III family protein [Actinacidiphila glaucinigra]WSD57752.1 ketoacyl-ACP synthase III family protein [Actinacidiphila glaucinigra]
MKTPDLYIAGLGVHVPTVLDARRAVELGLYDPEDHEYQGWTGAAVAGDTPAPHMAVRAARQAIERAGTHPHDLALHIHAGMHKQGPGAWSAQHYVLRHVTDRDIPSYQVSQGCNGLIGSLELAACHLLAVPERVAALVTGSDNVSAPHFNRWASLENGVIADGASAVVLTKEPGFARLLSINSGSTAEVEERFRDEEFPPVTGVDAEDRPVTAAPLDEAVSEAVGRQGELRTELALRTMAEADLDVGDITRVAHIFTGREGYLKGILDPIGLRTEQGLLEFGRGLGHMTVNDQIVGLNHLVTMREVDAGDHVLIVAHGGGVSITCAVVRIEHLPTWAVGRPSAAAAENRRG